MQSRKKKMMKIRWRKQDVKKKEEKIIVSSNICRRTTGINSN